MKKKETKELTEEEKENQRLYAISEELAAYLAKLQEKVLDCNNEMQRAMREVIETGEISFRINNEDVDIKKFFHTLLIVMNFDIPREEIYSLLGISQKRIPALVEKIGKCLEFFLYIPGVKIPPIPESCREQYRRIKEVKNG